jgi:NADPH:quinone reductase-like Zn-dependent oxidoreductase
VRAVVADASSHAARVVERPVPEPADDEILVAVRASSVVGADADMLAETGDGGDGDGSPVLGRDFAGVVVRSGPGVLQLREGDEVFGCLAAKRPDGAGSWADYLVVADTATVGLRPSALGHLPAAALPSDGCLALTVIEAVALRPSDRVLVVGASGGPGGYAVQLAARRSAEVIACAEAGDGARVRGLGASLVLTGGLEELVEGVLARHRDGVDCLIDVASDGTRFARLTNLVRAGGRAVTTRELGRGVPFGTGVIVGGVDSADGPGLLARLARLADLGQLRSMVHDVYGLEQAGMALSAFSAGSPGKIALLLVDGE